MCSFVNVSRREIPARVGVRLFILLFIKIYYYFDFISLSRIQIKLFDIVYDKMINVFFITVLFLNIICLFEKQRMQVQIIIYLYFYSAISRVSRGKDYTIKSTAPGRRSVSKSRIISVYFY